MASANDYGTHAALQPAGRLSLPRLRPRAAVETSIPPSHYPAECTQSHAFVQPSLRARKGRANSNSFILAVGLCNTLNAAKDENDLARRDGLLDELRALARTYPDDATVRDALARGL